MSTIKDVANNAGVSIGTVSNYINGTRKVSIETAKKIETAINTLNFKPNAFARNLKTNCHKEIGVILPNIYDPYYSFLLAGIERELTQKRLNINLALSNDIPEIETTILNGYIEKNICGLIIVSCQIENASYFNDHFYKYNIPVVFIDRKINGLEDVNFLTFNYYETAKYLLHKLFDNNHTQIGLVVGQQCFTSEKECLRAYFDFFKEKGIYVNPDLICYTESSKEDAFRAGISLLQKKKPSAVISSCQSISNGLEQAASLIGLTLGKDVELVSLGQENWSGNITCGGTINTMRPAHHLGKKAAQLLLSNMKNPILYEKQQIVLKDKIAEKELFLSDSGSSLQSVDSKNNELNVLLLDSPNANAVEKMLFAFTNTTGLKVNLTTTSHKALLERILEDKHQNVYDVYMYDIPWVQILVSRDILLDISDYIHADHFDRNNYVYDLFDKIAKVDGKYHGLPFLYGPQLLLYRKDLFENPSLREQFKKQYKSKLQPPRTWFEFNAVSRFFTYVYNSNSPVEYGTSMTASSMDTMLPELMPRIWAYGGCIFDQDNKISVDTLEFQKALSNYIETYNYTDPNSLNCTVEKTVEDFYTGKTAMLVSFASFISDINNHLKSKIIGKIGYHHIPGGYSVLGSWGLGISKHSKKPKEAFEFLSWACGPEMSNYFTILDGQSSLKDVYENDELVNLYPWLPLILNIYSMCKERNGIMTEEGIVPITSIESIIYNNTVRVLKKDISQNNAIQNMKSELESLIQKY